MASATPGFLQMIRAPFLSSIISPLLAGSFLAWYIRGSFDAVNFIVVLVMGVCLHIATNVYNDIYDTIQGTDKINAHRNEFSGGSGILVNNPDLFPKMYNIARAALVAALLMTVILILRTSGALQYYLAGLYLLSAFFAKYYTAAPVKLAYRGWGEISVWFAFGPMAILVAAVSQHVSFHPAVVAAMPATGISTLSILIIGQMIDHDADRDAGKWGIAVRKGNKAAAYLYAAVQLLLCLDVIVLSLMVSYGWIILFSLAPYVFLFPKTAKIIVNNPNESAQLKTAAKINVMIHLLFSLLFSLSLLTAALLG